MHRNTFLFIIFLGIIATMVLGINIGRSMISTNQQSLAPSPTSPDITPTPQLLQYISRECGISFNYPETFNTINIETGGATFVNNQNTKESIIVVCQQDIPRVSLTDDKIEEKLIGSVSANLYHDASAKDGTPIHKLIFTHPKTKKDVYIAGYGNTYNEVISSLAMYP